MPENRMLLFQRDIKITLCLGSRPDPHSFKLYGLDRIGIRNAELDPADQNSGQKRENMEMFFLKILFS
jgi:hypothetical protein